MSVDLSPLFTPRRVAVLGVSRSPEKLGHRLLQNILAAGFAGEVLPVNPSGETILGVPTLPRVRDLPAGLDLALVSLPAGAVVDAVRALAERGCRAAVILASGFGEAGVAGQAAESALRAIVRATGLRIVGPNCMGVVNVPGRLNGSYFWEVPMRPGGISFVSQSGAFGGLFFREVRARELGVAKFLSIGNQADLGFAECLVSLADDPDTRAVGLFVEAVRDGAAFVQAARRVARLKPVVAFKAGRGEAGRRAAGSHTGSLAGTYETYRAAFEAAGLVVVEETETFFDALAALEAHAGRPPGTEAVAILTVSGGPAVVAADTAEAAGLRVPALPEPLRQGLRTHIPAFGADGNPVDMTPQIEPEGFGPVVRLVLDAPEIAGAVAINVGLDRPEFGDAVAAAHVATGKPVVACTADTPQVDARLRAAGIPRFPTPERAVRAYRALVADAARRRRPAPARRPPRPLPAALAARLARAEGALEPAASRALLEHFGLAFPEEGIVASVEEALAVAQKIGYPVVVKTARPDVLHKTEVGGVVAGIREPEGLRAACHAVAARLGPGPILVQGEVEAGLELIVGGRRDPLFGPLVVCGLGGVLTEVIREVSVRLPPLVPEDAVAVLREGRKALLLGGFRGAPAADEGALAAILTAVGDLLLDHPEIAELDVNPLIVRGAQVTAVDALVIVDRDPTAEIEHSRTEGMPCDTTGE